MDLTTVLAIWGAGLSTLLAYLQVRQRRTRIRVVPSRVFLDARDWNFAGPALAITVFNDSDHSIRVVRVGLFDQEKKDRTLHTRYVGTGTIPGVVPPRDSGRAWILRELVEQQADLTKPIVAFAELSDGRGLRWSKPTVVD